MGIKFNFTKIIFIFFIVTLVYADNKNVLFISSFHKDLSWNDQLEKGFENKKNLQSKHHLEVYKVYLEAIRLKDNYNDEVIYNYIKDKYKNIKFDYIVTNSLQATKFVKKYNNEYFKDIPKTYYIYSKDSISLEKNENIIYNDTKKLAIQNYELAKSLNKNAKRLVLLSEPRDNQILSIDTLKELAINDNLAFFKIENLALDNILNQVKTLTTSDIVMYDLILHTNKETNNPQKVLKEILNVSNVPIFVIYKTMLGFGSVGGYMLDAQTIGENLFDSMMYSFDTNKYQNIKACDYTYTLDYSTLQKYNLPTDIQNASFINKPNDTIKKEYEYIIEVLSFIILLLSIRAIYAIRYKRLNDKLLDTNQELETIFNTSKDGIAILDLDTKFLFFNNAYLQMTDYTKEELLQMSCRDLSLDKDKSKEIINNVIKNGFVQNFEKTCIVKNNKKVKINMSLALMPDNQRILVASKDVTELKKQEKQIQDYIELIDKNIITSTTNTKGIITNVSSAFCQISGYDKDELIGQTHNIIRHQDMPKETFSNLWERIKENKEWRGEIKNKKKDGGYYWVNTTIYPIYDEENNKIGYTSIRQDITDKKIIEDISITDGLTNIYNRRYFNNLFPKFINSAKRDNNIFCFLILDIDHFKQYNDTYGHQMGDETLVKVATAIKNTLQRKNDFCFRLGGEEFGVIYESKTIQKGIDFANIIRQNIQNLNIPHEKNSANGYVTVSVGLFCQNLSAKINENDIYRYADMALYKAKENGRNQVVLFT